MTLFNKVALAGAKTANNWGLSRLDSIPAYPETVTWVRFSESASMESHIPQNECLTILWEQPLGPGQCTHPADIHSWFFPLEPFCIRISFYLLRGWNLAVFIKHLDLRVSPGIQVIKKRQQTGMFLQPRLCSEFEYSCHITLVLGQSQFIWPLHLMCINATGMQV